MKTFRVVLTMEVKDDDKATPETVAGWVVQWPYLALRSDEIFTITAILATEL